MLLGQRQRRRLASNYWLPPTGGAAPTSRAAPLTITANDASKTFGTTLIFNGSEFSASPLPAGETVGRVTLSSAGAANTASVAGGPYPIVREQCQRRQLRSAQLRHPLCRWRLNVTPSELQAVLVDIIGNPTKIYDGTDVATLTPANFGLTASSAATTHR